MKPGGTLVTIGELLVEFVSAEQGCGLEKMTSYSGPYPSGAPAIFIDQAARMGVPTRMAGSVGRDGFGRLLLARLREDGVNTDHVREIDGLTTGTAFVSYYRDGSRTFIFHLRGTAAEAVVFDPDLLPDTDAILHVSASSLGAPALREAIMTAAAEVLRRGGRLSLDPNARPELMRDEASRAALQTLLAQSHILMPSVGDLDFLFPGLGTQAAIDELLSMKAEIVALKRGNAGALVVAHGERHEFAPHAVDEVDPTGAGDCFCGTFVAQLMQGRSIEEAGRMANAAGALAVTRRGPMEGNTGPEEILSFMNRSSKRR
ncbi:MAG: sugar kinase [Rhizobiaceae bacterium]